jgi:hypothetical protein
MYRTFERIVKRERAVRQIQILWAAIWGRPNNVVKIVNRAHANDVSISISAR